MMIHKSYNNWKSFTQPLSTPFYCSNEKISFWFLYFFFISNFLNKLNFRLGSWKRWEKGIGKFWKSTRIWTFSSIWISLQNVQKWIGSGEESRKSKWILEKRDGKGKFLILLWIRFGECRKCKIDQWNDRNSKEQKPSLLPRKDKWIFDGILQVGW